MTSSNQQRLRKIEGLLTPQQAILLHLKDRIERFDSFIEYGVAMAELPHPGDKICRQIAESVKSIFRTKKKDEATTHKVIREAQMEAAFLMTLANETNTMIIEESQVWALQSALLIEQLKPLLIENTFDNEKEWRIKMMAVAIKVLKTKPAAELIQSKYFDSKTILFSQAVKILDASAETIEKIINSYNHIVGEKTPFDLDSIYQLAKRKSFKTVDWLVNKSKSEMFFVFGEEQKARSLIRPYVTGEKSG